ncbi:hypothetical protein Taro_055108, partial [Colocasia esculenta]|nr:hypothetical protein [Colocasia esculenta]
LGHLSTGDNGASALVTLTKRVAHEVGMFYVVNVLWASSLEHFSVLFPSCVKEDLVGHPGRYSLVGEGISAGVLGVVGPPWGLFQESRFDSFEVCPGVGTVVTTVVACGVPEWWHSWGYGWYLYPVWVMVYGVLDSLISECERLSPKDWEKHYNQSALQLESLNSSLVRAGKPPLSAEAFLDLNSINPIQELFVQWATRYSAFISLLKDLKDHQLFYPITIAHFLQRASFGKSSHFKLTLDKDQYVQGRPGVIQGVRFPSRRRKTWWVPGCSSLGVKEDQLGCWVL